MYSYNRLFCVLFQIVADAPWEISDEFLAKNKIDFVAHDEIPYGTEDAEDIYAHIKSRGMFVATERTEGKIYPTWCLSKRFQWLTFFFIPTLLGVSTSDIVARIVKDYDLYVRRNLARGYTAKDLNVSFLKEKKFRFQNKMDELKDKGKRVMSEVKGDIITKWEEKSRDFIETFLLLFGRERLTNMWDKSKGRIMQALSPAGSPNGSPSSSRNGSIHGGDDDEDDDDDDESYYIGLDVPTKRSLNLNSIDEASLVGGAATVRVSESSEDERQSQ